MDIKKTSVHFLLTNDSENWLSNNEDDLDTANLPILSLDHPCQIPNIGDSLTIFDQVNEQVIEAIVTSIEHSYIIDKFSEQGSSSIGVIHRIFVCIKQLEEEKEINTK
ncbi:hypothetical protein [Trichormus sp. NMC-1]|uniref:hypothetical protein n=1 Tax=Trichormus sp. NMC-1 TaxID=1853259 RepID=UPI0008DBFCC4|nr:hypothetical protein [Trichormus sp. NMC-1]